MIWLGSNVAAKIHCVEGDGTHRCALAKAVRRCWKRAVEKTPNGLQFRSANSMIFLHVQSFSIIFHGVLGGEKSVPRCHENGMSRCSFGTGKPRCVWLQQKPIWSKLQKQPKVSDGEAWFPKNIWAQLFVNWGTNLCNYFLCPKSCFPCSKDTEHQAFYGLI